MYISTGLWLFCPFFPFSFVLVFPLLFPFHLLFYVHYRTQPFQLTPCLLKIFFYCVFLFRWFTQVCSKYLQVSQHVFQDDVVPGHLLADVLLGLDETFQCI
ncbi:hypothetical protein ID866_10323 [Astraeus odoratus]|nr:hypothetical protein ID866_10323 [Astraeus odoratus]